MPWDIIVIFIVSQKLDPESHKMWEHRVTVTELSQELPSLKNFEEFLETRFRSLECLDPKMNKVDKVNCNHLTTTSTSTSNILC